MSHDKPRIRNHPKTCDGEWFTVSFNGEREKFYISGVLCAVGQLSLELRHRVQKAMESAQ